MQDFKFHNPTDIRFGRNHIDAELHDAVAQFGHNVLFVYGGQSIKKLGLYDRVKELLSDLNVVELGGVEPNPKLVSVQEGQRLAKANDIDVIRNRDRNELWLSDHQLRNAWKIRNPGP